jgi:hypothetical protein
VATIPILGTYPAERFATAGVQPASALYVSAEDQLLINAWNSAAGAILDIRWRIMRADGQIVIDHQNLVLTSARATVSQMFPLCEGFLLGVTAAVSGATPRRGQTFVQVGIARGNTTNPEQGAILISDYCTALDFASWPGGQIRSPLEGPGFIRSITGTNPGAGAEISESVPTNARWRIIAVRFVLTTSATVANRFATVLIDDGTNTLMRSACVTAQPAGQTIPYDFVPMAAIPNIQVFDLYAPFMQGVFMLNGWRWRTTTASIQVGDQYAQVQYNVEEWIDI